MKQWLEDFKRELNKHFYEDEVNEILGYYQEMIEERVASGEKLDHILEGYQIKEIIKQMTPDVILKRNNKGYRALSKSTKQLILILLSTPLLLPLGIVYMSFIIVAFSLIIASIAIGFSGVVTLIAIIIDVLITGGSWVLTLGMTGIAFMASSLLILIALWLFKVVWILLVAMLKVFTRLANNGGRRYEESY